MSRAKQHSASMYSFCCWHGFDRCGFGLRLTIWSQHVSTGLLCRPLVKLEPLHHSKAIRKSAGRELCVPNTCNYILIYGLLNIRTGILDYLRGLAVWPALHIFKCRYRINWIRKTLRLSAYQTVTSPRPRPFACLRTF